MVGSGSPTGAADRFGLGPSSMAPGSPVAAASAGGCGVSRFDPAAGCSAAGRPGLSSTVLGCWPFAAGRSLAVAAVRCSAGVGAGFVAGLGSPETARCFAGAAADLNSDLEAGSSATR